MNEQIGTLPGSWELNLRTPIGTLHVRYHFDQATDGLHGTATSIFETVPLENITVDTTGDGTLRATWRQQVTKPMRLNLDFEVEVTGGTMTGHSRAGRLPRAAVTGQRVGS
jgi:hypothetical protein